MNRMIDDQDYIEYLPSALYVKRYLRWREAMIQDIEDISTDLQTSTIDEVMERRSLSPKDIALLVRLKYFTAEEVAAYDLLRIEKMVPL